MSKVYLSLGSNLGDRAANLNRAVAKLDSGPVRVSRVSSIYETTPVGVTDSSPDYLNLALKAETDLAPRELLEYVKSLERELGRAESYRWGPRIIDIDILLFDDVTMDSDDLTIPHPRMLERKFVLVPLLEIEPEAILPDGRRVSAVAESASLSSQSIRKTENGMRNPENGK